MDESLESTMAMDDAQWQESAEMGLLPERDREVFCGNCGAPMAPGSRDCGVCGSTF